VWPGARGAHAHKHAHGATRTARDATPGVSQKALARGVLAHRRAPLFAPRCRRRRAAQLGACPDVRPLRAQEHIFALAGRSTVDALIEGYSGCIIAYGQARARERRTPPRAAPHAEPSSPPRRAPENPQLSAARGAPAAASRPEPHSN
jgi:hypothetical protein